MKADWHRRVYKKKEKFFMNRDDWHKLRMACLRRDKFTCVRCEKKNPQGKGLTAHHMIPRDEDGADDINNLITLCNPCHDFVEINNLRTFSAMVGSYEMSPIEFPKEKVSLQTEEGYHFTRPEWHKYVYGGQRKSDAGFTTSPKGT